MTNEPRISAPVNIDEHGNVSCRPSSFSGLYMQEIVDNPTKLACKNFALKRNVSECDERFAQLEKQIRNARKRVALKYLSLLAPF